MTCDIRLELGDLKFTWDLTKYRQNVEKHGITFEEAATTWLDPGAIEAFDSEHSSTENRWFRIGFSLRGALVVTWSSVRMQRREEIIRIIGARRANPREHYIYEEETL